MRWHLSWRADPLGAAIADRHYTRQTPGSAQFVQPGRCLVLRCEGALWVTSWPLPEYVKHAWPTAWVCSTFRNERPDLHRSSGLIIEALAATKAYWGRPPEIGLVTMVDPEKVRHKRDPGRCFRKAGFFLEKERTKEEGHLVWRILPKDFPPSDPAIGTQSPLWVA